MLYPSIDKLLTKVDSKYSLVVAAAKRARMLREGAVSELENPKSHKPVGVALEELYADYIYYEKLDHKNE
ncbi:DNA-directed RNA polymerase subunit omega [Chlamydia abortus]|uniref:DNA-directed RNA polymerase subunit omega n=1 Tax=Paenibacillus residui TaxID=629724 RepID=A0ABW3D5H4_9BACL|nr:DNA-directed RNA polymerase subunit omega [Paenibacillus sp. 32O-W]SHE11626.1 DNA-directed RNA polymerase subunit omega [Chlamydia abortus]